MPQAKYVQLDDKHRPSLNMEDSDTGARLQMFSAIRMASLLAECVPTGASVYQLIAVALATDYSDWLGMKGFDAMRGRV